MLLTLLGCAADAPTKPPPAPAPDAAVCPATAGLRDGLGPPTTVIVLGVDTLHRDFLGVNGPPWDTTPRLDALMAEGTRLDHVIVPRGLSGPSMATIVTGAYPRTHGVRANDLRIDAEGVSEATLTLGQRFGAAGYATYGYSANQCYLLDADMDTVCTWADPTLDQAEGDALLVGELVAALGRRGANEPVFAWLHLLDPHDPYTAREPWFSTFHPGRYDGPYAGDAMDAAIAAHMAGTLAYTEVDRAYVEAVYASQVAATDAQIGLLLDGLAALGRLDDAVIAFTIDHGDALARRDSYFYHGCSPYDGVLDTTWALWAPGRVPAGHVVHARVPSVELAPTLAELAGLPWDGPAEGKSLLGELRTCAEPERVAFFERGGETAGVVAEGWKFFLDPNAGYDGCKYFQDEPYPNPAAALYDLDADPLELDNRATAEPERAAALRATVCAWVNDGAWVAEGGENNALVAACR